MVFLQKCENHYLFSFHSKMLIFIIYIQFALFWWVIRIMKSQCCTSLILSILVILKKLSIKTCKFWFVNRNTFFRAFSVSTIVFTQISLFLLFLSFLKHKEIIASVLYYLNGNEWKGVFWKDLAWEEYDTQAFKWF